MLIRFHSGAFGKIRTRYLDASFCTITRAAGDRQPPPATGKAFLPRPAITSPRRSSRPAPTGKNTDLQRPTSIATFLFNIQRLEPDLATAGNVATGVCARFQPFYKSIPSWRDRPILFNFCTIVRKERGTPCPQRPCARLMNQKEAKNGQQ